MAITKVTVTKGWEFHTADFSCKVNGISPKGNVTLMRDMEQHKLWQELPEHLIANTPLFVTGEGFTLNEAIDNAFKLAAQLGNIQFEMAQAVMTSLEQSLKESKPETVKTT